MCSRFEMEPLNTKRSTSSRTDPLRKVESLTFRSWWHLLARYTSVVETRDSIRTVLKIMAHRGFRHLPVVSDGKLIGIVSAGDLIDLFTRNDSELSSTSHAAFVESQGERLLHTLRNPVSTISNPNPVTISPDETILEAIETLSTKNVGSLLIVEGLRRMDSKASRTETTALHGSNGKLLGIVTLRDVVSVLAAYAPFGIKVEDFMTREVATVSETDSVYSAMSLMSRKGVRRLPVLTTARDPASGRSIIGMVTNKMILRYLESVISYEMLDVGSALKQAVKTVMMASMPLIDPREDCGNAAYLMRDIGTGGFAVVDSDGLVGVITERDLVRRTYKKEGVSFFSKLFETGDARVQDI